MATLQAKVFFGASFGTLETTHVDSARVLSSRVSFCGTPVTYNAGLRMVFLCLCGVVGLCLWCGYVTASVIKVFLHLTSL